MIGQLDRASTDLLDRFQHDFPLVPAPFAEAGRLAGTGGAEAIDVYRRMIADGLISRIGAVVAPNAFGASTLAAIAVPEADLEMIAETVSAEAGVNHNYERENRFNLWFVVSAPSEKGLTQTLDRIECKTGLRVLDLRLEEPFHLDLGFSLGTDTQARRRLAKPDCSAIGGGDHLLLAAIQDGIPLVERPYRQIGEAIGWSEDRVLARLAVLVEANVIRRFGVVIRHRAIGMKANAMAVWDVGDEDAGALGRRFAAEPGVTLCYRRRRDEDWRYNLYCMVHGVRREETAEIVERLDGLASGVSRGHLFSRRCFKQSGARFGEMRRAS